MTLEEFKEAETNLHKNYGPQPILLSPAEWFYFKEAGLIGQDKEGKYYMQGVGWVERIEYAS